MIIKADTIPLLKNFTLLELEEIYYDLHNDFNCINIRYDNRKLIFIFENIIEKFDISIIFLNTNLVSINLPFKESIISLTADNFYRGRYEVNNQLYEFSDKGQSYFYIEFYESHSLEFFSDALEISDRRPHKN